MREPEDGSHRSSFALSSCLPLLLFHLLNIGDAVIQAKSLDYRYTPSLLPVKRAKSLSIVRTMWDPRWKDNEDRSVPAFKWRRPHDGAHA